MARGTVVRFDEVRGYGFITPDGGGEDVFMHINDLDDEKSAFGPGVLVEFDMIEGDRGLKASSVRAMRRPADTPPPMRLPMPSVDGAGDRDMHDNDDGLSDVLSDAEFTHELTELFLRVAPELTGAQIAKLRQSLVGAAKDHGWVEV